MTSDSHNDSQNQVDLVRTVIQILSDWDVTGDQQVILIGLPKGPRPRELTRFRMGMPFSDENDFLQRAHYILSIKNAVDSIHPFNATAANYWVTTGNMFFAQKTPLDIMLAEGLSGMKRVLDHLDGVY